MGRRPHREPGRTRPLEAEEALGHLLTVVRIGTPRSAERAVEAIGLYRSDGALRVRPDAAVGLREGPSLRPAAEKALD